MFAGKKALLLDMNNTFMFGEDRFGADEDFSLHYFKVKGTLSRTEINKLVRGVYEYLGSRYPDENFRHCFPSLESAILAVADQAPSAAEITKITATFAFHELGHIPNAYAQALHFLKKRYILAAVIDIWSPKKYWLEVFEHAGIAQVFSAISFSSDHGWVKPSPKPYEAVLKRIGVTSNEAIVIGDSLRRDLGGAKNAGIDCVLVGGAEHPEALMSFKNLLEFCQAL